MRKSILCLAVILAMIFANFNLSFGASDPDITLVNPVTNSVSTSSSLLISVKLTAVKTIKVSAYELQRSVPNPAYNPASKSKVSQYITQSLGDADMKAIESEKFDTKGIVYNSVFTENYNSTKKLSFYTKKLEDLGKGVYLVKVETVVNGKSAYMTQSFVQIKEKTEDKLFSESQNGAGGFLQGLVKSVFGN